VPDGQEEVVQKPSQVAAGLVLQQTAGAGSQQLKTLKGPHFLHFSLGAQLPLVVAA
jgi:hypothetical protein